MADRERGKEVVGAMFGGVPPAPSPAFADIMDLTIGYLFGEIWSRPGLARGDRSLATVSVLAAQGHEPELKIHLKGALANGLTPVELREVMIHLAHYAGWATAMSGLRALESVMGDQGLTFPDATSE